MSRWVLALVAVGFALAPVRAVDPKPVWEIDLGPGPKPKLKPWAGWVAFAPGDSALALVVECETEKFGTRSYKLRVWDAKTRKERFASDLDDGPAPLRVMPLAAFVGDGAILTAGKRHRIHDLATGKATAEHGTALPTGREVWFPLNGKEYFTLRAFEGAAADERPVLVRSTLPVAAKREPPVPVVWQTFLPVPREGLEPRTIALNPACDRVAIGYFDKLSQVGTARHTLGLYRIDEKFRFDEIATVVAHAAPVSALAFSPDGQTLATGSEDGTTGLWDVAKAGARWQPAATFRGPDYTVSAFAFRPDGKCLAVGTWDKKKPSLQLIDVPRGRLLREWAFGPLLSLAFSADGKRLATSASGTGTVHVWDADELMKPK